ncbi:hypothetical protein CDA39_25145 [Klebsiella pneumoniae]|nr:hypothetical protein CDA39_25145 [Klebsiella pneumoniae]
MPGGGSALPGIRFVRPAVNLFTIVAETAGADGLKIAETFPEGRGSLQARASAAPPGGQVPCPWWCRMAA